MMRREVMGRSVTGRSVTARVIIVFLGLFALLLGGIGQRASAHDLQTRVQVAPPYVEVTATYEGTEPASFLSVTIHAPASAEVKADAFQTGRTDYNGKFVFRVTSPGDWRIALDDEMGHKTELVTTVKAKGIVSPAQDAALGGLSTQMRLLVGLSLIAGLAGLLYGWTARKQIRND